VGVAGKLRDILELSRFGAGVAEILKRTPGKEAREAKAGEFVDKAC
jgi:tRNA U34 5-carboxymethylaminomethyl modifying GTPase MnmE/TrmE